jgi:hypothetical protein
MSSVSSPQSPAGAEKPAAPDQRNPKLVEWGDEAIAEQAAGSLKAAWKKFIKTKFYVAILRSPDDDPRNFLLHLVSNDAGAPILIISEVRERLDQLQGDGMVALSGADILRRIGDQGGIQVTMSEATFNISKKRVEWLRSGIEVTKARVVIRKILQAAAPAAPLPVLRVTSDASLQMAPVIEDEVLPRAASVLASPLFKPVVITLVAVAVIGGGSMFLIQAPEPPSAPAPAFEAPPPENRPVVSQGAPVAAPAARSMTFAPTNNSFRVSLPGQAEEVELSPDQVAMIGHLPTNHYRLLFDGILYTMESTDYITRSPDEATAELDARQKTMVGTDGRLLSVKPLEYPGGAGREVRVRMSNGGVRAARFVFIGSRFSMVEVMAPKGDQSAPQIDAFLNSFQLN